MACAAANIPKNDIFAFDPSRECDVVSLKLEKMEAELDEKKMTIKVLLISLRSAATLSAQYGNISLHYHRELNQFRSMKNNYDQLILERENHCMSDQDKQYKLDMSENKAFLNN